MRVLLSRFHSVNLESGRVGGDLLPLDVVHRVEDTQSQDNETQTQGSFVKAQLSISSENQELLEQPINFVAHCHTYRTLDGADAILKASRPSVAEIISTKKVGQARLSAKTPTDSVIQTLPFLRSSPESHEETMQRPDPTSRL
ncbi:hypothetical protein RRG08_036467 [Elysia crispata]|uniref:Uncharacterized protein n=1 Tax=Elysia crispata TaxID=231223 RepID=A0AAE1DHM7_9GAST|nr:hypothetical protein RRG08_036467 [Elysia crispata]